MTRRGIHFPGRLAGPRSLCALLGAALVVLAASAPADEPTEAPSVAVAGFEVAGPAEGAPDVARLLADRLATRGLARVVGPGELAAQPVAEPAAATVQEWAGRTAVDAVVVGRTTRIGARTSVDVRLRDGASGEVLDTYVAEIGGGDALETSVDALAVRISEAVRERFGAAVPVPEAPPAAAPVAAKPPPKPVLGFDGSKAFDIKSDELEFSQEGGSRVVRFKGNVKVTQGQARIFSDRLDAFYPPGSSQPNRMEATGSVRLLNGKREARCRNATYYRDKDLLVCKGSPAKLLEGPDVVNGSQIDFDLAKDTVKVKGAEVLFNPGAGEGSGG